MRVMPAIMPDILATPDPSGSLPLAEGLWSGLYERTLTVLPEADLTSTLVGPARHEPTELAAQSAARPRDRLAIPSTDLHDPRLEGMTLRHSCDSRLLGSGWASANFMS